MQKVPPALAPIVYLPGLLYEALVRARNGLYSANALPQHRLPGPVISVGNITMGGTGKTPLVIHIAQWLVNEGFHPAILTRGYKRARPDETLILAPDDRVASAAGALGDEPALVRRRIPSAWMGISRDRFLAGMRISERLQDPVFILDDGFQHRRLRRDLDIVVLDRSQALRSNRVLPRGTLREPLSGLRRCGVVVLNGVHSGDAKDPIADFLMRLAPKAAVFRCSQTIESMIPFPAWSEKTFRGEPRNPRSAYLVAALGNPGRFEKDVRRLGIEVRGVKFFPDHYSPTPEDWQACAQAARAGNAETMVTTEKDAVKISSLPDFPLMVSMQSTLLAEETAFERMLTQCVGNRVRREKTGARGSAPWN